LRYLLFSNLGSKLRFFKCKVGPENYLLEGNMSRIWLISLEQQV
jgi:hypothetical protein